jgi:hypothetical protein
MYLNMFFLFTKIKKHAPTNGGCMLFIHLLVRGLPDRTDRFQPRVKIFGTPIYRGVFNGDFTLPV